MRKGAATQPFSILPQRELEEARKRLNEQAKSLSKILLNHVGLDMAGTEMAFKYRSLKLSGKSNFVCALMMVNKEMEKRLGKERQQASSEEFRAILDDLDDLLQTLVRRVRKAKADYDKNNA
jgi:DNA repair protein RadD